MVEFRVHEGKDLDAGNRMELYRLSLIAAQELLDHIDPTTSPLPCPDIETMKRSLSEIHNFPGSVIQVNLGEGTKDIGFGIINLDRHWFSNDLICNEMFTYIDPNFRKLNLGPLLVEAMMTEGKRRGAKAFHSSSTLGYAIGNEKAINNCYIKNGLSKLSTSFGGIL